MLTAVLLILGNLGFASHVSAHFSSGAPDCEWCVCQDQTPAVPLVSEFIVLVNPLIHQLLFAEAENSFPLQAYLAFQSRAPPLTI
ncbi:MAG: hypothetical protein SH820_07995 [Xanthomonadales bacterium]|nr:hypothetical protein [Xanthomonadales bacterium]